MFEDLGLHNLKTAMFPHYANSDIKLQTLETWPIGMPTKPKSLCDSGFYYTERGDKSICFHFGGGLNNLERSDDPWVEHTLVANE